MNSKDKILISLILAVSLLQPAMARRGQYDEEARAQEKLEKEARKQSKKEGRENPAKRFVGGVKQATVDSTADLLNETAQSTVEDKPVVGTLEGAAEGTGGVLDNAVKGVSKVATLGYGEVDSYEVEQPKKGTDEPTKIKIKIPGT